MKSPQTQARGRLAPTPSGLLHLGNARTFLATWLSIRSQGGEIFLRIEDIDRQRSRPELEAEQIRDLEWLGLDWDGPIMRQSERLSHYQAALAKLKEAGRAFPCICTRRELSALSAPHAGEESIYPGTCGDRFKSEAEAREASGGTPVAWRFKVESGLREVEDLLRGTATFDTEALVGDFQIFTKESWPSYQLAVVVDDAAQGITEVVRGADLHASAARQIELAKALGISHAKRWAHLGLVQDAKGERMAKRRGATSLQFLRQHGVEAEAVIGLLAQSLGLAATPEPITAAALVEDFSWAQLSPQDCVLDSSLLLKE